MRGGERERLSYRALDVEQIGSVYETVMGFTVEAASGRVLAIKAGKNNRTPVFVALDELLSKKGKDRIKETLHDALGAPVSDLAWSNRLGGAAMELLWALAADAPAVVLEANFRPHSAYEQSRDFDHGGVSCS